MEMQCKERGGVDVGGRVGAVRASEQDSTVLCPSAADAPMLTGAVVLEGDQSRNRLSLAHYKTSRARPFQDSHTNLLGSTQEHATLLCTPECSHSLAQYKVTSAFWPSTSSLAASLLLSTVYMHLGQPRQRSVLHLVFLEPTAAQPRQMPPPSLNAERRRSDRPVVWRSSQFSCYPALAGQRLVMPLYSCPKYLPVIYRASAWAIGTTSE